MLPGTPEFNFAYDSYTNLAFKRRGLIINETIFLERLIDAYICDHFCKSEELKNEMMELIVSTNRMIFENKIQVVKILLEKHNPEVLTKHPSLIKDITDKIIPERNIFAHYWLVTSAELVDYIKDRKTVFIKFKNTTEHISYDDEKITSIMKLIAKSIKIFNEI